MTPEYDHRAIEEKWMERWEEEGAYLAAEDPDRPKK